MRGSHLTVFVLQRAAWWAAAARAWRRGSTRRRSWSPSSRPTSGTSSGAASAPWAPYRSVSGSNYPNRCKSMSELVNSSCCYVGHFSVCSCPWADPPLSGFVSGPPSAESHFAENIFKVNLTRKYISAWIIFLDVNIFLDPTFNTLNTFNTANILNFYVGSSILLEFFFMSFMQEIYHYMNDKSPWYVALCSAQSSLIKTFYFETC